jgi:hypothetical protein
VVLGGMAMFVTFRSSAFHKALIIFNRPGYPWYRLGGCSRSASSAPPIAPVLILWLGLLFSKLMRISHSKGYIDRESYIAQYLALSIFTIGIASTIGADDLLAAFAAGLYPL